MSTRELTHRADIDGLRAVAVLSVIGFHCGAPGFSGGYVGVDVFFVLSGYLIGTIVLRDLADGSFSLRGFYVRRSKRILPALLTVLIFCILGALVLLSPQETQELGRGVMATTLSISNIAFWRNGNYFDHGGILNPLLMTWSLAVEEQFYVVFPLFALLLYRRGRLRFAGLLFACCALSFALCVDLEFRHPSLDFYSPFTRAWEMGAGTLLAAYQVSRPPGHILRGGLRQLCSMLGMAAVLGCVFGYSRETRFPGYEAVPVVAGTLLVIAGEGGVANRLLALRPVVLVGLISYSLYLWHWPLLSLAAIVDSEHTSAGGRAVLMGFAAIAAMLSYRWVETPFRRARGRSASWLLLRYGAAVAAMIAVGASLVVSRGVALRTPRLAQVEQSLELSRSHDCIRFTDRGPDLSAHCVPPPAAADAVALIGDSHAEAFEGTLRTLVEARHETFLAMTGFSCPPLRGYTRYLPQFPEHGQDCARFNEQVLRTLEQRPDVKQVVLLGSWGMLPEDQFVPSHDLSHFERVSSAESAANVVAGVTAEVRALEAVGKEVVLIDDWPSLSIVPLDGARYAGLPARRWVSEHLLGHAVGDPLRTSLPRAEVVSPAAEAVRKAFLEVARTDPRLRFVDTKQIFCGAELCRFAEGAKLLYTDAAHMSRFGAEEILTGIDPR